MANASRNAQAGRDRYRRWAPSRDALWEFLAPHLDDGARVAIVGAGNGDDLPLRQIIRRAGAVTLIDLDPSAVRGARRRLARAERRKVEVIGHDVAAGAADSIVLAVAAGEATARVGGPVPDRAPDGLVSGTASDEASPEPVLRGDTAHTPGSAPPAADPLPGAPYDLVVGDLLYSQLLYPALLDFGVDAERRAAALARHAPALTGAVVGRLHASAPLVVHVHDPLAWWDGHEQPVALGEILDSAAREGPDAALELVARGVGPHESDPRAALPDLGLTPTATALWRWPFAPDVDYLACATLVTAPGAGLPSGTTL